MPAPEGFAVVGAGLAGSATAWRLAGRGHPVTLVERDVPAGPHGSSHGSSRIVRHAYPDPFYAGLVTRALQGWAELERAAGQSLLTPLDALDFGALRDVDGLSAVLAAGAVPHRILSAAAARERWPGIAFDTDVLHHDGAALDAAAAVAAMTRLAEAAGAQVLTGRAVVSVVADAGGYVVTTTDDEVRCAGVVLAAGGWLPDLWPAVGDLPELRDRRLPALEVRQEQVFHYPYREPAPAWPALIHKSSRIQTYGLPGGRDAGHAGQKVAEYRGGRQVASAAAADGVVSTAGRDRVTGYVERYLPGLVPEPYAAATCLFTVTPTEDFVIDRAGGVTVVSACSGHGAKFGPLTGALAADVATGARPPARFALPRR